MLQLIDSHCHLDATAFDHDREQVLAECRHHGIQHILIPGTRHAAWSQQLNLCAQHLGLYAALGMHPYFLSSHTTEHLNDLEQLLASNPHILAVGEIGLDYHLDHLDKQQQQFWFESQLALAAHHELPVILHVRKAHDVVLQSLKRHKISTGIVHAFNGSLPQAKQYIGLGFKLGFGGVLTYPRAHKIRQLAQQLPLESIVLETDSPDMVVSQHQGQRNHPAYLRYVLQALADIRQQPTSNIAQQTSLNFQQLFQLKI